MKKRPGKLDHGGWFLSETGRDVTRRTSSAMIRVTGEGKTILAKGRN